MSKTNAPYLRTGVEEYLGRLKHYCKFEYVELPDIKASKNLSEKEICKKEGESFQKQIDQSDYLVLLDEGGKSFSSLQFADQLANWQLQSFKRLHFLIGGAYGFDPTIYEQSDLKISLSNMTFSHQMVRLLFLEQLYRGHTILKGEPYHHR